MQYRAAGAGGSADKRIRSLAVADDDERIRQSKLNPEWRSHWAGG